MSNRGSYRKYTAEERSEAVRRALQIGSRQAAEELGYPLSTVARWAQVARANDETEAEPLEAVERARERESNGERVVRRYTPSEKARAVEYARAHGVSAASRELGMSRHSIYTWIRRVKLAAEGKGDDPTTGPDPDTIEAQRDREILAESKQHPGLGPSQISNQLRRRGIKVSVNTVRRGMEDDGYRPPKIRRHEHTRRYESVRPNHLWHLDFVHRHIHKASTFSLILIDDYSRFVTGFGIDDAERSKLVLETFEQAVRRYGRPEMVMTDRGSAFWSWRGVSKFTTLLTELGIDHIAVRDKEANGKIEVFNGNLTKELFDVHRFTDVSEMTRRLEGHLHWYNHHRTHHALGGLLVPADRYYGRADEVIARLEHGLGHGGDTHTLDLRTRQLDLFRVVQREGVAEIWLLGQKLMSLSP